MAGVSSDLKLQDEGENKLHKQVVNVVYNSQPQTPSIKSSNRSSGPRPTPPVLKTFATETSFADESFKLEETLIASISVHSQINHNMKRS